MEITLYPSNWLYNAGVIGLLRVLEQAGENVQSYLRDDGSVEVTLTQNADEIFKFWDQLSPKSKKEKPKYYGHKYAYYTNQTKKAITTKIGNLLMSPQPSSQNTVEYTCTFCFKQEKTKKSAVETLTQAYSNLLLASQRTFPNAYWNNNSNEYVCSKCQFVLMCHHLALIELPDNSEMFINASSFKVMWYLNMYAREKYQKEQIRETKKLLGISLIELATRLQVELEIWTSMNIEIVSKDKDSIDFFSLPYDIVLILTDREVAGMLNQIGEFNILNMILDGNFKEILEIGERIVKIVLKPKNERNKSELEFIKTNVKLEGNKNNLSKFSSSLLKLYALIEDRTRKGVWV